MTRARLALLPVLLALGGCSAYGPLAPLMSKIGIKPKDTAPPLTANRFEITPKVIWNVAVGKSEKANLQPVVVGNRVYVATADGVITILEEETGKVVNRIETKTKISGGVAVDRGRIIVSTAKGEVIAYEVGGKPAWTASVAGEVISPATVSDKALVIRTSDGRLVGLNPPDGKRKWVYQRQLPALLLRSEAGGRVVGKEILLGVPGGKLLALDLDDGKLVWEASVASPRGATEIERIADIVGLPAVEGKRLCAAAFKSKVACFDLEARSALWSRDIASPNGVALDASRAFVSDDKGHIHGLDGAAGSSLWKQEKLAGRILGAPAVTGELLVIGDSFGQLQVLDPRDGALVGRLYTDGSPILSITQATQGVVVQTKNGSFGLVRF